VPLRRRLLGPGGPRLRPHPATCTLHGDPGLGLVLVLVLVLGTLIRGPVEGAIRAMLVNARPGELRARAEG
jgi:hypothetical protein